MSSIPEIEVTDAAKNMSITEGPADPWCDEKNPRIVDFEKISAAAYRIHGGIVKTPCDVGSSYNLSFCYYYNLISVLHYVLISGKPSFSEISYSTRWNGNLFEERFHAIYRLVLKI